MHLAAFSPYKWKLAIPHKKRNCTPKQDIAFIEVFFFFVLPENHQPFFGKKLHPIADCLRNSKMALKFRSRQIVFELSIKIT